MNHRRVLLGVAGVGIVSLATLQARAAAFAAPGGGQQGLAVGADKQGVLRASVCAREPCDLATGVDLGVPAEFRANIGKARLTKVAIGGGRRAIVASVPGAKDGGAFEIVVAAPLGGNAPKIVFAGATGLSEGADGVRQGKVVTISEPDENGARSIVIGLRREDLDLCGRSAVLAPEVLNFQDLSLRAAKVQRLGSGEREQAEKLVATRVPDDTAAPTTGILRAVGASSAVGSPAALTDGRAESVWAEARGGSGRGEFVVMNATEQLPLSGFEFVLTPPGSAAPSRASVPREVWIATQKKLYQVTLPDEAAQKAGARFAVTLPAPVRTDCVALVLESAFEERAEAQVGVAELAARTDLSGADPKALFGALAGGGERAEAAGALLRTLGAPAFAEINGGFTNLDEGGRRVALEVIDAAPCEASVPVYVKALIGSFETQRAHAQSRLRRCGRVAATALNQLFTSSKGPEALTVASELGLVAPDLAVESITARLARATVSERKPLRIVLARAASDDGARPSVLKLLADTSLPSASTLGLLRALGPRALSFLPESGAALQRLAGEKTFATRYLLLAPAAVLAPNDANARTLLLGAFDDRTEARLRTRSLEVMPRDAAAAPVFVRGLADENVRVREAAAHAVRDGRVAAATAKLVDLIDDDEWPLVRAASAEALSALPAEAAGNKALVDALDDDAPVVRTAAASALGARRVFAAAEKLRDHLIDKDERVEVRRASATALGNLCDGESVAPLIVLTNRLGDPMASLEERSLGEAALGALVQIGPSDLAKQLEPLKKTKAAGTVQAALAGAAGKEKRCTSH